MPGDVTQSLSSTAIGQRRRQSKTRGSVIGSPFVRGRALAALDVVVVSAGEITLSGLGSTSVFQRHGGVEKLDVVYF